MIGKADSARSKAGTISLIAATVLTVIAALPGASADEIQQVDKLRAKAGALAEKALAQQGGSRLVFKVDAKALRDTMVTDLRDRLYRNVHDGRVPFSGLVIREGVVEIRIAGAGDRDRVLTRLTAPSENPSVRGNPLDVVDKGDGVIRLTPTDAAFAANLAMLVGRAMGVIDQRLDDSGIKGAGVLPDGDDRIRLALPGIREPERVAALFFKKVPVSFRLIDVSMSPEAASTTTPPPGSEILYGLKDKTPYLVLKDSVLDGDDLDDVAPGFGPDNKEPIVSFRFNARGQRRFAHVTEENIGKPFAIALGDKVISAPVIREPITGGQGQISGNFTLQEANSVAMTMLAAALPGRLTLVAQQVIEPAGR